MANQNAQTSSVEELLDVHMIYLARKFLAVAERENEKFVEDHAEIAVTAAAATGGYALIDASMRIFAYMICRLPPERQEAYIMNLVNHYEPSLRAHIASAAKDKQKH